MPFPVALSVEGSGHPQYDGGSPGPGPGRVGGSGAELSSTDPRDDQDVRAADRIAHTHLSLSLEVLLSDLPPVLAGCRVLVIAQRRSAELAAALTRRGAEVVVTPSLGVVSHIDEPTLLARSRDILQTPVDTFVATTGIGFRGWLETAETAGLVDELLAVLAAARLLARGPKALGAMRAAGLEVEWVAESETAAEVADLLVTEGVRGRRIAVQHHAAGDDGLDTRLTAAGADVVPLVVYRWGPPPDPRAVRDAVLQLADGRFDAVAFTSAPGAAAWLDEVARLDATDTVRSHVEQGRLLVAAVGPVTAEPLEVAGMRPVIPDRSRLGALIRRIVTDLGNPARGVRTPSGILHVRASSVTLDDGTAEVAVTRLRQDGPPEVVHHGRERLRALPPRRGIDMTAPVLVACSHGTADPGGTAAVSRLVDALRSNTTVPVVEAFVDVHGPYVDRVVAEHEGTVVVVPLLLAAGFHVRVDIAGAVSPWPAAKVADALGPDARLTDVLVDRMRAAGVRPGDAVVLAAAGSSDDAAESSVRSAAGLLEAAWGHPVSVAYGAARHPRVTDEVARLRSDVTGRRIAVVSYLLATGHFHRRLLATGADVLTQPLLTASDTDPRLVDLVLSRYEQVLRRRI